jgi:hypothetical protein
MTIQDILVPFIHLIELFNSRLRIKSKNNKHDSLELQRQQSLI